MILGKLPRGGCDKIFASAGEGGGGEEGECADDYAPPN